MSDALSLRSQLESLSREELIAKYLDLVSPEETSESNAEFPDAPWVPALMNSTTFCMATTNARYQFKEANRAFCEFIGYSREELIGKHISIGFLRSDLSDLNRVAREVSSASTGEGSSHVRRYRHRSGQVKWGSVSLSAYRGPRNG